MNAIEALLRERGALLEGHFLLSSGLHSDRYVQCARLFEDPAATERLGRALAVAAPGPADVVVSPALGAVLIGYEVARSLGRPFLFTERLDGKMTLRRGFALEPGRRVLIVEDVLTTGGSTREVAQAAREQGAVCVGAAAVVNRGCGEAALGMPVHSLLALPLSAFAPPECPLCGSGKPLNKPGSRPT